MQNNGSLFNSNGFNSASFNPASLPTPALPASPSVTYTAVTATQPAAPKSYAIPVILGVVAALALLGLLIHLLMKHFSHSSKGPSSASPSTGHSSSCNSFRTYAGGRVPDSELESRKYNVQRVYNQGDNPSSMKFTDMQISNSNTSSNWGNIAQQQEVPSNFPSSGLANPSQSPSFVPCPLYQQGKSRYTFPDAGLGIPGNIGSVVRMARF